MARTKSKIRYTIRGVPAAVDRLLRGKARQRGISLNSLLIEELSAIAARGGPYRSLKDVTGRWQEDPEFDRILDEQRQIDPDLWK